MTCFFEYAYKKACRLTAFLSMQYKWRVFLFLGTAEFFRGGGVGRGVCVCVEISPRTACCCQKLIVKYCEIQLISHISLKTSLHLFLTRPCFSHARKHAFMLESFLKLVQFWIWSEKYIKTENKSKRERIISID